MPNSHMNAIQPKKALPPGIEFVGLRPLAESVTHYFNDLPCALAVREGDADALDAVIWRAQEVLDLALSIATPVCYQNRIAERLAFVVMANYGLANICEDDLHLCMQEMICNAVIHGNLSLKNPKSYPGGLDEFSMKAGLALARPENQFSAVHIMLGRKGNRLVCDVIDEGCGYDHSSYLAPTAELLPYQGLALIKKTCDSFEILGKGNHIRAEFELAGLAQQSNETVPAQEAFPAP